MGVIDEVKQRTDIVEVISQYTTLTKAGRTFRGLCPFHSEKHPSFFVYPEQQSWHCFGACNSGGDVFSFIMKKEGIDFGDALRLLAEKAGVTISSRFESEGEGKEKERLYQINQAAAQYFHNLLLNSPAGEKARSYVASRGFSLKTITDFQLGFSLNNWEALKQYLVAKGHTESELLTVGLVIEAERKGTHDRFRNKLMFPIHDIRGHVIGFGARVLDDSLPKYINSPQTPLFDKSSSLYGINLAAKAIRQQDLVVIVEGYMDVITAHQNGFDNVVASMGTAVTEKQIGILKRLTKNITLALDADAAGQEASRRGGETAIQPSAEDLAPRRYLDPNIKEPHLNEVVVRYYRGSGTRLINENAIDTDVKVTILPSGKDPDDIIKEDIKIWQNLVEEALPVIDYTFNMFTSELDLTTAKGKSIAVDKLLPIIAEIKNDIRRDHYLQKLADLIGTSYNNIEGVLSRIRPVRGVKESSQKVVADTTHSPLSSPVEEYCLALLLQYPELTEGGEGLSVEYFENSENREIFIAWQKAHDLPSVKAEIDSAIWGYLDSLMTKSLPSNQIEQKYTECVLRLREKFLRSLEAKRGEMLALEAKAGGTAAELAKLEEQGIESSIQLGGIFTQKIRRGQSQGR